MSSSLLLVLIVVVWLFVLAPLVVNTRQPIRRTSEALGRTRLLHQGGESVATRRRRPTLTERDVRAPGEEVDESLETVDAELDDLRDRDDDAILIDDLEDRDGRDGRDAADRRGTGAGRSRGAADDAEVVPAVVEGDVVYELEAGAESGEVAGADSDSEEATVAEAGRDSLDDADAAVEEPVMRGELDDADATVSEIAADETAVEKGEAEKDGAEKGATEKAGAEKAVADSAAEDARLYLSPEDFLVVDAESAADESAAEADDASGRDAADAADADVDAALIDDDAAAATATATAAADEADLDADAEAADALAETDETDEDAHDDSAEFDDTLTDDDLAFAERRRGRGGFDPVSDARYAETRFARRRRSVGVLALFIILGVILGAFVGGWTWWLPLAGAGLMVLYLVYLRRTVLAENELRARRIRRMKMARLGVRNSEDEELGIPERLRRPGAVVVELDDEDPDFADLPYSTYEFPEEDIRRAAGQ